MRVLLILFSLIYFFIAPYFDYETEISASTYIISFTFIICLFISSRKFSSQELTINENKLIARKNSLFFFSILTAMYCLLIYDLGLLDRRQGSEYMALLFSQISIVELIIFRVYEIIFWPIVILIYLTKKNKSYAFNILFIITFLAGLIFSGALTSRTKIITTFLMFFIFSKYFSSKKFASSGIKDFFLLSNLFFLAVLTIVVFAIQRSNDFYSFSDYFFTDIFVRLNGIYLIHELLIYNQSFFGTGDLEILRYYTTALPFLESSSELKELGLTNSKSYLLRDVMGFEQYDVNNSILTDPFYVGGIPLVAITGLIYGSLAKKIDFSIASKNIFQSRITYSFLLCVVINLIRLENDLIGILIGTIRDFAILFPFTLFFSTSSNKLEAK
jgi:oligosaccharide repeat unit polymerase